MYMYHGEVVRWGIREDYTVGELWRNAECLVCFPWFYCPRTSRFILVPFVYVGSVAPYDDILCLSLVPYL